MGGKRGLTTEAVVEAAADLVNAEGSEALSLSKLAQILNIQTPSLYNHVGGLPGLQREMALLNARRLAERITLAAIGRSGVDAVWAVAQSFRDYIKTEPGLYWIATRRSTRPAQSDPELNAAEGHVVEIVVAVLSAFNLEGEDAIHAVRGLRSLVHGFATLEAAGGFGLPLDLEESFHRLVEAYIAGLTCSKN